MKGIRFLWGERRRDTWLSTISPGNMFMNIPSLLERNLSVTLGPPPVFQLDPNRWEAANCRQHLSMYGVTPAAAAGWNVTRLRCKPPTSLCHVTRKKNAQARVHKRGLWSVCCTIVVDVACVSAGWRTQRASSAFSRDVKRFYQWRAGKSRASFFFFLSIPVN